MSAPARAKHPSIADLRLYVCGGYVGEKLDVLESHICACDSCAEQVSQEARLELQLEQLGEWARFCADCQSVLLSPDALRCGHCGQEAQASGPEHESAAPRRSHLFLARAQNSNTSASSEPAVAGISESRPPPPWVGRAVVVAAIAACVGLFLGTRQLLDDPQEPIAAAPGAATTPAPDRVAGPHWRSGIAACDALLETSRSCRAPLSKTDLIASAIRFAAAAADPTAAADTARSCRETLHAGTQTLRPADCETQAAAPIDVDVKVVPVRADRSVGSAVTHALTLSVAESRLPGLSSVWLRSSERGLQLHTSGPRILGRLGNVSLDDARTLDLETVRFRSKYERVRAGETYVVRHAPGEALATYSLIRLEHIQDSTAPPASWQTKTLLACSSCH